MEKDSAQQLQWLINEAVRKGWDVQGHNGKHPTSTEVKPGALKYTAEHLIAEDLVLAILANGDFLVSLFDTEAQDIVAQLSSLGSPLNQIDFIYRQATRTQTTE